MRWTPPAEKKMEELAFALNLEARVAMRLLAERIARRNKHDRVGVSQVKAAFRHEFSKE